MRIPQTLPVTAEQSRAARFQLGLTQAGVIEESSLPGHKLKNFETGRFVPDMPFLESLRDYYASKGIDFTETVTAPAPAPAQEAASAPGSAMVKSVSRMCFYVTDKLPENSISAILQRMDENDERIEKVMKSPVKAGLLSQYDEQTENAIRELFVTMSESYLAFRMLQGRNVVKPKGLGDTGEATTVADLLANFLATSPLISLDAATKPQGNTETGQVGGEE